MWVRSGGFGAGGGGGPAAPPFLQVGNPPYAQSGLIRFQGGDSTERALLAVRNAADNADHELIVANNAGVANDIAFQNADNDRLLLRESANLVRLDVGGTAKLQITSVDVDLFTPDVNWRPSVVNPALSQEDDNGAGASADTMTLRAQDVTGSGGPTGGKMIVRAGDGSGGTNGNGGDLFCRPGNNSGTGAEGNTALGAEPASWQSMQRGYFFSAAQAEPTGDPAGGFFLWSEANGFPVWRCENSSTEVGWDSTITATASAGAGTLPADPEEFITVNINGNTRKIPLYLA